jgi:hypothetical protein
LLLWAYLEEDGTSQVAHGDGADAIINLQDTWILIAASDDGIIKQSSLFEVNRTWSPTSLRR